MVCTGLLLLVLGLPLLIVYAFQQKEKKNRLWLTLGIIFMLLSLAFFCAGVNSSTHQTLTATPAINGAATPAIIIPTFTLQPLLSDTPDMVSCSSIAISLYSYRDKLTNEQYHLEGGEVDLFIKSLYGKGIDFRGVINDVIADYVFISDDTCGYLSLSGIPHNETILFNKGSIISGYGTVGKFTPYEDINIWVDSYKLEK